MVYVKKQSVSSYESKQVSWTKQEKTASGNPDTVFSFVRKTNAYCFYSSILLLRLRRADQHVADHSHQRSSDHGKEST